MISGSRKNVRNALYALMNAMLTGGPKRLCKKVYACLPDDFSGQSPVVCIASSGSDRRELTFNGLANAYLISIYVLVAYPTKSDLNWTDEQVEDLLDDIEEHISKVVKDNQRSTYWEALTYAAATETDPPTVIVGGVDYRREVITIRVE